MRITKVIIKNYRCLRDRKVELHDSLNIIVGDNECGKSTFLEAVHLALSGSLNGRPLLMELHPHLFNAQAVNEFAKGLPAKTEPPSILIELYLADDPALAAFKGTNNLESEDVPGIRLSVELNDAFRTDYAAYIADASLVRTIPVEFYTVIWRGFSGNSIATSRSIPIKPSLIDASTIRNNNAASRYVLDMVKDGLSPKQRVDLALSYRLMKDQFRGSAKIIEINKGLAERKGEISEKELSVSLDTSSRASWETGIVPHLDEIPMPLVGKGEQNSVKIKLAMDSSAESHLLLIEEPENHLSFSRLNMLINYIAGHRKNRQLLITTHSSYVLNKLGVDSVLLFTSSNNANLRKLDPETLDYFLKLPGYDTLRLILAKRAILVEGPSDELIVQKAYKMKHGCLPLEAGIDVISVQSLAFKRFLEIAVLLGVTADVVTDNDGDLDKLKAKYKDYLERDAIRILYDDNTLFPTLEPQLLKANGRDKVNKILKREFADDDALKAYMKDNKTECALRFFETDLSWDVPEYIQRAVA